MKREITCINCPVGCRMTAELSEDGAFLSVAGNTCPRGAKYAQQECTSPTRTLTAVIQVPGSPVPLSVKTASPVPKERIFEVMQAISAARVSLPVRAGQVILKDVLGTGSDIIATRSLDA